MIIKSKINNYELKIEKNLDFIKDILQEKNTFFVIDKKVYAIYFEFFKDIDEKQLFTFEANENNKSIDMSLEICSRLMELPSKRNTTLVSIGGGIIQDVTGFVANIMYRGIKWIFVPTTLLASCDSCIGGKTSINYKSYKNLLGTFYTPNKIYVCPKFFETLTDADYKSGLGEVVKFNIMTGLNGVKSLENNICNLLLKDNQTVLNFLESSISYKKQFVEDDEFDKGKRVLLNYGHTFGHALEVSSKYEIPHGTAVAIGVLIANDISVKRGYFNKEINDSIIKTVKKIVPFKLKSEWLDFEIIINAIKKDKKQVNNNISAILINENFDFIVYNDILEEEIRDSILSVINILKD